MKKQILSVVAWLLVGVQSTFAGWQQKTSMPSDPRVISNIFVIGTNAYIGGGFKAGHIYLDELWEYNTLTDTWTQKANLPVAVGGSAAFTIGTKGYIANGWVNGLNSNGVYEYDPFVNSWTAKNNFPGAPRYSSCVFVLNNKAYIGLGYAPLMDDLWQYDPVNDAWTQMANFPGGVREGTAHFALNGLGYVGCGLNNATTYTGLDDFYTYNDASNTWTQIGNFMGPVRHSAYFFVINNKTYVACGNTGNVSGITYDDLWQFNPQGGIWTQLSSLPDTARQSGGAFAVGNCGYIFGGFHQPTNTYFNQLWQYCDVTGMEENENALQAELLPQPGNSEYIFKYPSISDGCRLEIADAEGKIILEQKIILKETKINLSKFSKGIYLWKFYLKNEIGKTGKIVL